MLNRLFGVKLWCKTFVLRKNKVTQCQGKTKNENFSRSFQINLYIGNFSVPQKRQKYLICCHHVGSFKLKIYPNLQFSAGSPPRTSGKLTMLPHTRYMSTGIENHSPFQFFRPTVPFSVSLSSLRHLSLESLRL